MANEPSRMIGSPVLAQGIRFLASGGVVALVYVAVTSLLSAGLGLPFELALAVGFLTAISTHFTLQRLFVWRHADGFALPVKHQAGRYLALAGAQYGITVAATALLPRALGVETEIVYLVVAACLSVLSFIAFRVMVFHPEQASRV